FSSSSGTVRIQPGGTLSASAASLRRIVMTAYGLNQRYLVVEGPQWIDANRFDIQAKAEAGGPFTAAQVRLMLRSLLEDRFHFRAHTETRQLPIYQLTVARSGLKLPQPKEGS